MLDWNHKNVEENIGRKILDIAHSNILWDIPPQARETKEKINKWDYTKLKNFHTAKKNINKIKTKSTKWENVFADTSDKELIFKIYREHIQKIPKENPIKKMVKGLE